MILARYYRRFSRSFEATAEEVIQREREMTITRADSYDQSKFCVPNCLPVSTYPTIQDFFSINTARSYDIAALSSARIRRAVAICSFRSVFSSIDEDGWTMDRYQRQLLAFPCDS